jgi:hypothetical protein
MSTKHKRADRDIAAAGWHGGLLYHPQSVNQKLKSATFWLPVVPAGRRPVQLLTAYYWIH